VLVRGKSVAVDVTGAGNPVIFLHGLGSTSSVWEPQTRALGARFRLVRYDLDGAGRSKMKGPLSIESWVEDLGALLQALALTQAHFVGHSLGTLILQHFAVANPAKVLSLTLIGVNRAPNEARRQAVRERAAKVRAEGIESIAATVVKGGLSPYTYENKLEVVGFVRELLLGQSREDYAASLEAMAASNAADISKISAPVLVLAGGDDTVSPPANGEAFAREIADGRFQSLQQCGHWHPIEQPVAVNEALKGFLG
jgi:3-oxoadipate enol-lactonase